MPKLSNCQPERLQEALNGSLNDRCARQLADHLETCLSCRQRLEAMAATESEWQKASDYFSIEDLNTDPFFCQPTVDIQLNQPVQGVGDIRIESEQEAVPFSPPATLQPPSHPEMLGRIDCFEIEQVIGRGGMGVVYKGYDRDLSRPVAIKVLADHLAANGVARQRFAREARAAAAVIHPNVVPIHSVNSTAGQPYLVMTLVAGRSLQAHVESQGPLGVKDTIRISRQIAAGLAAAHREGLVHRDIKPANILLEKDVSRIMITDFGLARAADDAAITQTGWLAGTPHYMSPEQASGREVDFRSDLFSLGSVMYFMATGREPFRAEVPMAVLQKIAHESPHSLRSLNSDTTRTLQRIIERLMARDPDHRYQTAEEVESVLTQYLAHLEQPQSRRKPKIKSPRNRSIVRWLTGAAMLILSAALVVWQYIPSGNAPSPELPMPAWMQGLQSPQQWQQEVSQLERDIRRLEQNTNEGHNLFSDPVEAESTALKYAIDQLEQRLKR